MALTPQQIIEARKSIGLPVPGGSSSIDESIARAEQKFASQSTENKPGLLSRIGQRFSERDNQMNVAEQRKQSVPEKFLQSMGAAAGFVTDAIGETAKSAYNALPRPARNAAEVTGRAILETPVGKVGLDAAEQGVEAYQSWKSENPRDAANLESIVNIVSLFPPVKGGQVVGKTGATVAGEAVEAAAKAATVGGRATSGAGELLYKGAIRPNTREAEQLIRYRSDNPLKGRLLKKVKGEVSLDQPVTRADTALQQGIYGNQSRVGYEARRKSQKLYTEQIAPVLKETDAVVTKDELFAPITNRIDKTVEPGRKKALQEAFAAIQEDYSDINVLSLEDAQKIKSELDEFTPEKMFRGQNVASEYKTLKNDMANAIRRATYSALKDKNIKRAYLDYGNLRELEKIGVKSITEGGKLGGFGNFWTSIWDMAAIPVRTVGGQVVYRIGNKLEFTGQKGIKKFSDYLKTKGYKKPSSSL